MFAGESPAFCCGYDALALTDDFGSREPADELADPEAEPIGDADHPSSSVERPLPDGR